MKRLLDESPDELTRSLLVAGIEDRPAPGNQARVIAALGAGGALGLFSSNAFAWLGTTAGKVTAAGITVGVAGALFVAVPHANLGAPSRDSAGSKAIARLEAASIQEPSTLESPTEEPSTVDPASASRVADVAAAERARMAARPEPSVVPAASDAKAAQASPAVKAATRRLASWRERRLLARKRAATAQASSESAAPDVSVAASAATSAPLAGSTSAQGSDRAAVASVDLDSEVRLVDEMHQAARRNDREALGVSLARYRETFPHGQLEKEVAEFAVRWEQSDSHRTP